MKLALAERETTTTTATFTVTHRPRLDFVDGHGFDRVEWNRRVRA